jgi:hypothetical protein
MSTEPSTDGSESESESEPDHRERMERALRQIRREGWKAALIQSAVDATALFLAVNLLLSVVDPSWLRPVTLPADATRPVTGALGRSGPLAVPGSALCAAVVALVALAAGIWVRGRRSFVERFEAVNPPVGEALRTARDAAEGGASSRMTTRLYADVLDRLQESSSAGLVSLRRVALTLVVIVAMSAATTQVAVYEVTVGGSGGNGAVNTTTDEPVEFSGLQDGGAVLGDSEELSAGDENISAEVESTDGDQELDSKSRFPTSAGGGETRTVDSQQAGFAQPEQIADAELVREYNIRIREPEES